jgi:hypothetical protein
MSAYTDCVKETVSAFVPDDLGWWLLAILIACLATAVLASIPTLGIAMAAVIPGCAIVVGITIVGPALVGLVAGLLRCIKVFF